jgi:CheY-like chemotaxis protein
MHAAQPVGGPSILVVDDETLIVMLLEDILLDLGCRVVGQAATVSQSIALIQDSGQTLDGAFLDINLRGELVYPVADVLLHRGVPFVFVTGNALHGIDPRYAAIKALAKPFSAATIEQTVALFTEPGRQA